MTDKVVQSQPIESSRGISHKGTNTMTDLPSISENGFACPHCGNSAQQDWYRVGAKALPAGGTPKHFREFQLEIYNSALNKIQKDYGIDIRKMSDLEIRSRAKEFTNQSDRKGLENAIWIKSYIGFLNFKEGGIYEISSVEDRYANNDYITNNIWFSKCYICSRIAIWIGDSIVCPRQSTAPKPAEDMPDNIRVIYDEASSILELSPRASALLIRYAVEKICDELCKNQNKNKSTLSEKIDFISEKYHLGEDFTQILTSIRIIGNEAAHGKFLSDDNREMANRLFRALNYIVEKTIHNDNLISAMKAQSNEFSNKKKKS